MIMSYQPIENYGIIGDLHTTALVGMDGSIDFFCFPTFDSPSVFAAVLDTERGGHFRISPLGNGIRHKQLYLPDTNVLLTRFLSRHGVAEISDFMPIEKSHLHRLVRRVKAVRGEMRFRLECHPAFDYARAAHQVELDGNHARFVSPQASLTLRLRSQVKLSVSGHAAVAEFMLREGETAAFVLEEDQLQSPSERPDFVSEAFKHTVNYWRDWIGRSSYQGRWREMVHRSALLLKLLTYAPQGSLLAAPTFGLPEEIGGVRNWDYRYTWIRDASFTLYALSRLGFSDEARAFMGWIQTRCAELADGELLQVMYGIRGERDLREEGLQHFEGYLKSSPVRIGNAAFNQLQLDIYGALMDAVYLYDKHGEPIAHDLWRNLVRLIAWVCEHWRDPDHGIWEIRGEPHPFLYSRLMCWVAIDRGYRLAQKRSLPAPLEAWRHVRDAIYHDIFETFWDDDIGAFVQYEGSKNLDASCLLMPLVRFISPTDPRWLSTFRAVERHLVEDSLVYRYRVDRSAPDGLPGDEGTFTMCSFWYVECLSRAGDVDKARFYFEKMLGYANHLGLYAEELGRCGEHLGNFPQAFTHLALISAAFDIDRRISRDR
jgi:GH15 family glucan-1,4-alpha-glucosidase